MGATAADTQREIAAIRQDLIDAASELDRRVTRLIDVRAHGVELADWGLRQLEERPLVVAGAGLALAAGATFLGVKTVRGIFRRPSRAERVKQVTERAREEAADRLQDAITQAQALLTAGAAAAHQTKAQAEPAQGESSMLKKLLWGAITAGALAIAGIAAQRLSAALWRAVMHEEPPTATE